MNATDNDTARQSDMFEGLQVVMTQGIAAQDRNDQMDIMRRVRSFRFGTAKEVAAGTADSVHGGGDDPYKEHDFGSFRHNDQNYFWKIDDYGEEWETHGVSQRHVLTVMQANEY
jgi:hypothetical protein